jgi:hypothetical protein
VIINQDRWLGATPSWPYGLDAYQHYVVNHEVGHWMGFGHSTCPGPWQPAPVMVQQSKGGSAMGWCSFNTWPTPGELGGAGARHGVPVSPTGLAHPDDPFGSLDAVTLRRDDQGNPTSAEIAGWALDGDTTGPLRVLVAIDGQLATETLAEVDRPDLTIAFPRYGGRHGFVAEVPVPAGARTACAIAVGTGGGAPIRTLGCAPVK